MTGRYGRLVSGGAEVCSPYRRAVGTDYASIGRLLANPARSTVVDALMGGRALTAGELAGLAGVGASTISEHLAALVDGGLLTAVAEGRHRYFRLATPAVSDALEALSLICPTTPVRTLRQSTAARADAVARTCYDHLAGALGVAVLDGALAADWFVDGRSGIETTPTGADGLVRIGVDVAACRATRRQFARLCLDRTERRMHLSGALGAALLRAMLAHGWFVPGTSRSLKVTAAGRTALADTFDVPSAVMGA
jgi:DNA-binding transcriptional ArsR family regulator